MTQASLFQHNTMRLTSAPEEIGSGTRQAWDALFDVYGFEAFHPVEGRGVLMSTFHKGEIRRSEVVAIMQRLIDRGFAIAP